MIKKCLTHTIKYIWQKADVKVLYSFGYFTIRLLIRFQSKYCIMMSGRISKSIFNYLVKCNPNHTIYIVSSKKCAYKKNINFSQNKHIIIFKNWKEANEYFSRNLVGFPELYINVSLKNIKSMLQLRFTKTEELKLSTSNYYNGLESKKIESVLIVRALVNSVYDSFLLGLEENDIKTYLLDCDNYYSKSVDEYAFLAFLERYKPSALLTVNWTKDHMKYFCPERLIILSWMDVTIYLQKNSKDYLQSILPYNYLVFPCPTLEKTINLPASLLPLYKRLVVKVPFVSGYSDIQKWNLSKEEKKFYSSDVCVVANWNSTLEALNVQWKLYTKNWACYKSDNLAILNKMKLLYRKILYECRKGIENQFQIDLSYENFCSIVDRIIKKDKMDLSLVDISEFTDNIYYYSYLVLYRQMVLDWLLEQPFKIKIWGRGWEGKKYLQYAQGEVAKENLGKVYAMSLITLSTSGDNTLHRRALEAILNGSFYLSPRPRKKDYANIQTFFTENEDIIFFDNKTDMEQKLCYYLSHEDERLKIIRNGQKVILKNNLTPKGFINSMINQVEERLKKEYT